jgi:hypothetical protein
MVPVRKYDPYYKGRVVASQKHIMFTELRKGREKCQRMLGMVTATWETEAGGLRVQG